MARFVTLTRSDENFRAALLGHALPGYSEYRAIPVRSLNVGSKTEQVTFEMVPLDRLSRPSLVLVLWRLLRLPTVILATGPAFVVWMATRADGANIHSLLAAIAGAGLVTFQFGIHAANDVSDHMAGRDRIRAVGGTRVIQNGWLPAFRVRQLSILFLVLSAASAVAALAIHPAPLWLMGVSLMAVAALLSLDFLFSRLRIRERGGAELLAFLMSGPLLTVSFGWVTTGGVQGSLMLLGCVFGSLGGLYVYLGRLERLMPDAASGERTWPVRLGFERAKAVGVALTVVPTLWMALYIISVDSRVQLWPALVSVAGLSAPLAVSLLRLRSPLASDSVGLRDEALKIHWLVSAVLGTGYASLFLG